MGPGPGQGLGTCVERAGQGFHKCIALCTVLEDLLQPGRRTRKITTGVIAHSWLARMYVPLPQMQHQERSVRMHHV